METATPKQCDKIQTNITQEIKDEMEIVDSIKMEYFQELWILKNDFNTKKFVEYLSNNRVLLSLERDSNLNNTLSIINENIFLYSINGTNTGCLLYPQSNETNILLKYFSKKLIENSSKVNVLINSPKIAFLVTFMNRVYEQLFENSTDTTKSEIDMWSMGFLKGLMIGNKSSLKLNTENSKEINCLKIEMHKDLMKSISVFTDSIFDHYVSLEENTNTEIFSQELTKAHFILNKAFDMSVINTEKSLRSDDFEPLVSAVNLLKINITRNYFSSLVRKINHLKFLHFTIGTSMDPIFFNRKIIEEIENSIMWYEKLYIAYVAASRCLSDNLQDVMRMKLKDLTEHYSFKSLNSNAKEKHLEILEQFVFKRQLKKECVLLKTEEVYKLQIHGDLINFKDIPDMDICKGKTKYIELFATEVLTIDSDLVRIGEMMQIVAVAPKWIVIGSRNIVLTGAEGKDYDQPAEDGQLGVRGEDGLPGLPGGPGGIFIGIAEEIINKENLEIFADGGLGGTGQEGGKGGKGPDTRFPTVDDYDEAVHHNTTVKLILPFFEGECSVYYFDIITVSSGGNGGNGGKGGFGGNAGEIFLLELNGTLREYLPKQGGNGYDGFGGDGGLANYKNESIVENCGTEVNETVNCENCTFNEKILMTLRNGTKGQEGGNIKNIKIPIKFHGFKNFDSVVNDYKTYIRPYLDSVKLLQFYTMLIHNEEINKKYGTFGLLDELKGLEKHYLNLTKKVDLLPMYDNLQRRIEKSKHRLNDQMKDHFVALDYAYTAALSRASRLIETGYFVPNLQSYVECVSKNLDKLREDIVQYSANQLGEDYKQSIEKKIREARIIIEEQLRNDITRINGLMKRKIYDLINETIALRNKSAEKKRALKNAMIQQTIFTFIKSALLGITALIPGGQAAAIIAFTTIQVGEVFAPEFPEEKFRAKIPVAVGNRFAGALEFVKQSKIEKHKNFEKDIQFLRNEKNKLDKNDFNKVFNETIQNEIRNLDNKIEKLLKKEDNNDDGIDFTKMFDVVGRLKAYYNHKQKNTDAVEVIENDTEKKETLKNTISSTENDFKHLHIYENRIYDELIPVFEVMRQDLPSDETLRVQSVANLDVSKWKVQTALKNVKLIIKQFTKGFKIEDEINLIIENLGDIMNTLISIYDQIQNFQQEKKLAAYVKQLSNLKYQNFHSKNEMLENSVLETRFIIRGNLALIQYEKIFKAFKQLVFPFANKYMKDLHKPSVFEITTNSNSSHWFSAISENVDKIKNKISEIQGTIFKKNKFNERLEYGNKHQGEIYMWKNESHHEMISDLLDGKEVMLFPDARKFPHFAVKFTRIRIGFVTKIESDQKHLTELLNVLEMRMTHEGNSYYTCGNKMYLISHSPITLVKTFNESYQGESDSVQKLANGDDLVSPFATWRVQISRSTGGIAKDYFVNFKNKVDLVLEGTGTYVQVTDTDVCDKNTSLTEYYEEYIPIVDAI